MSAAVVTPRLSTRAKAAKPFLIIAVLVVALIIVGVLFFSPDDRDDLPLSAHNYTPSGAAAITHVMADHNSSVVVPTSAYQAVQTAKQPGTVLVVVSPNLMAPDVAQAVVQVPSVVYLGTEQMFAPLDGATTGTDASSTRQTAASALSAQCDLPAARKAGTITADVYGVSVEAGWTGCFPLGDGLYGYAEKHDGQRTRVIIASSLIARNQHVAENGNTALVLNALSPYSTVVWWTPTPQDTFSPSEDTLPPLLMPLLVLCAVSAVLLALAWGRRLGHLVPEDMPGFVPAAETVTGRGRLLQRGSNREHAARSLRIAAATRIAAKRGIDTHTQASIWDDVDRKHILRSGTPRHDKELIALANDLDELEKEARP